MNNTDILGTYRNYKDSIYEVLGEVYHTNENTLETENLILYRSIYEISVLWITPVDVFLGTTELEEGKLVPTFTKVSDKHTDMNDINLSNKVAMHTETDRAYKIFGVDPELGMYTLTEYKEE